MAAASRLRAFLQWTGWSQQQLAVRLDVHQTSIGRLLSGARGPGVDVVHTIEKLTAEPREDGEVWPDGPIRTEEWVESKVDAAS